MSIIEVKNLSAGYSVEQDALDGLNFALDAGRRLAVLGPNGGGKTTLFRVLDGTLRPRAGEIVAPRCAVVPQTERSRLDFPVSALDVASMGVLARLPWYKRPGAADRRLARLALERVGLGERQDTTFGELSGGQRQRALIARALVQEAPVLLLDEPFSGLDEPSAGALNALIGELAGEGRALLIATHDIQQARDWDLVLCLNRRQVGFGDPEKTLTPRVVAETYGGEIVELPQGGAVIAPVHGHGH